MSNSCSASNSHAAASLIDSCILQDKRSEVSNTIALSDWFMGHPFQHSDRSVELDSVHIRYSAIPLIRSPTVHENLAILPR